MLCGNCGKANSKGAVFCGGCGTRLPQYEEETKERRRLDLAGLRNSYPVDFLVRLVEKENLPVLAFLVLNVFIIGAILANLMYWDLWFATLVGLGVYVLTSAAVLSPVGEVIFRFFSGCRRISDPDEQARLIPLFEKVYGKVKEAEPSVSGKVRLYMKNEDLPDAFTLGRNTICITRGLLAMPDEMIEAAISHEFGHLARKDTDRMFVVAAGYIFITAVFLILKVVVIVFDWLVKVSGWLTGIFWLGFAVHIVCTLSKYLVMFLLYAGMFIWRGLEMLLCGWSKKLNEYQADRFAYGLGYGNPLCSVIGCTATEGRKRDGVLAYLTGGSAGKEERIRRLMEMGAVYGGQ
ncbi:MAG: M48 family metalloprotease [Lachnospiraceae bacterium]|nr:M48 family metalloprotease [Lachnospiraceae bacterium]